MFSGDGRRARKGGRRGHGRHRAAGDRRHGGPPAGQAADRGPLPRRGARARRRGLQLPARGRRRHGNGRRLRDVLVGDRLRGLRDGPRPLDPADGAVAAGDGDGDRRPAVGRRPRSRRLAAADPAQAAGAPGETRDERQRRHRARVHRLPRHLRVGLEEGLPRPRAGQPLQHRLLAARDRAGRAADPADPQRDGRRRADGGELEGRVQPRPARGQLPLRGRAAERRQPRGLQERRQGDRRPGGDVDHLHGEVQRARGELVPHPLLAGGRRRHQRLRRRPDAVRELRRRPDRLHARADPALRAARQLLQTLRRRLLRADRDRLGQRQPHLLAAGGRPRRGAAGGEPAAGRRRQSLPGAERDDRRRAARDRQRTAARAGLRGQRLQLRQAARAAQHLRRARRLRGERGGGRRLRRRGGRALPEPGQGGDRRLRGGGHRLGALPGFERL